MPTDKNTPTNAWVPEPEVLTDTTEETPVAASKGSKSSNQTDDTVDATDPQEGALADASQDSLQQTSSSPEQDPQDSPDSTPENYSETSENSEPVVVNDPDGQHVDMPDGSVVHTRSHPYPVSNAEWETYEVTHSGDQERYPYVPGDKEYSPYSDPHVPNSHVARMIETEIASYAERVLNDPDASVSNIWDALKPGYDKAIENAIDGDQESGKVRA